LCVCMCVCIICAPARRVEVALHMFVGRTVFFNVSAVVYLLHQVTTLRVFRTRTGNRCSVCVYYCSTYYKAVRDTRDTAANIPVGRTIRKSETFYRVTVCSKFTRALTLVFLMQEFDEFEKNIKLY
jgi:hypothetical protein